MLHTIENERMKVTIHATGAQLWSVQDEEGTEYLWQGDKTYWSDRAINLFPYIARLTAGKYELNGHEYAMDIHGFLKDSELRVESREQDRIVFALEDSESTRAQYPYRFVFRAAYALERAKLSIVFSVENRDDKRMYFGMGGHPGFNVPLEAGLAFEQYCLIFEEKALPQRVGMSPDCFVTGTDTPFALTEDQILPLRHALFDDDAIILKNMCRQVRLCSNQGKKAVTLTFPDMKYLGIWHMPRTDAPYVCIEPWTSLPSRKGVVAKLERQEDLISLPPGEIYCNAWSIEL